MSDLNTEIKIGADASGVEAGVGRAKKSLADLGGAATKAGASGRKSIEEIGYGGDQAAKKVESATRSMQNSIQRLIAEQKAGEKGSRAYYEALADSKGISRNSLKPLLDQLDAAKRKTDEAKDAAEGWRGSLGKINGVAIGAAFAAAVVGVSAMVKKTIDAADSFSKLSAKSGIAVESLRELNYAASLSDVSTESLATGVRKLSQNMAAAAGGAKQQTAAFDAIGVSVKNVDGSLKGADQMVKELASKFATFKDGPEKAALAIELFGKQGAEMIPLLNGGAAGLAEMADEANRLGIVFDGDLAKNAEAFNDNLTRIQTSAEGAAVAITEELLPTLNNLAQAFVDSQNNSQSFAGSLGGGLRTVLEATVILASDVAFVLHGMGREIGGIVAQLAQFAKSGGGAFIAYDILTTGRSVELDAMKNIRQELISDAKQAREDLDKFQFNLLNARFLNSSAGAGRGTAPDPRSLGVGEGTVAPIVKQTGDGTGGNGKGTKEALSDYDKFIQKLSVDLPKAAAEAEAAQMGYNKAQTEFLALAGSDVWAKFTNSQRATVAVLFENKIASEQSAEAAKTIAKANLDAAQSREKYITSLSTGLDKIQADIAAQIEATERMGLSKEAIADLDAAKLEMLATDLELQAIKAMDRNLDQQTYDALKAQAQAYRELGIAKKGGAAKEAALDLEKANADAAKKAQEEWERAAEQINSSLTDALLRGFESGKDFAKNLRDTVVNMFKTMVLRPVISAVLSPVSMALSGLTGAGSAAAGQAGGSALGSAGGSLMGSALGGIGAFGTGASYGAASLFANGLSGTLAAGGQMIGAGSVMSGLGTIAGALGPIAIGIALLSSLIKKSTPHMGGGSSYSAAGGLVSGEDQYQSGVYGFADSRKYDETAGKLTADLAKSVVGILDSTATSFGKQAGFSAATAFADDSSKDGAWGALVIKQMGGAIVDWADTQNNKWAPKEFADGEAGQKEYLAAIAKSTRDALDAMDLPGWADDMLAALGDAPSLEGLAQTVDQINAASAAIGKMGQNLVGFSGLTDAAVSALVKAAGGMDNLVTSASSYYDNFYSEAEKAANITRDVADALAAVGLQMPTTRDDFRALVESQMALGESGASAVAALLGVSGAFASVTEAAIDTAAAAQKAAADTAAAAEKAAEEARRRAEQIAQEKFGLESKLMQLLGDTAGLRAREIDALDASNRALQEHIYALQDAKAAEEAAKGAIETAYSSLERAVSAEKDAINKQLQAQQDGYQAQIDAAQSAADSIKSIASALASAVKSTQIDADSFDFQRLKNARSTISSAAGSGNLQYAGLENALGVAGQDSKKFYGRFEDYAFEQGVLAGNIGKLNNQAQGQLTTAEKTLQQLKDQMRISGEQSRAQLAALDAQLVEQRNLADVALGIDNSVLSVKAAVDGLQAAIAGLAAAQAASAIAKAQVSSSGGGGGGYGGYSGGGTAYEGATYTDFMGNQVALQAGQSRQFLDAVAAAGTAAVGSLSELRDRLQAVGKSDIWEALSKDLTLNYQDFDQTYGRGVPTISASDGVISAGGYRPDNQSMQDYAANISAWAQANGVQGATNNGYSQSDISNAINTTLGQGASIADIINAGAANFGLTEQEIRDAARAAGIPGFASGGYFGGGLRIVGENGPELEATGPARIWNAADTANMLGGGNGEMVAELRALRAEVAELKASNNAIAGHTAATHRQLVRIAPNDKVQTEVAA